MLSSASNKLAPTIQNIALGVSKNKRKGKFSEDLFIYLFIAIFSGRQWCYLVFRVLNVKSESISRSVISAGPLMDQNLVVRSRRWESEKEKRLIFPGLRSRPSRSRESARNREREKDVGTQALMEQGCFIEFCKSIYTSSFFR